MMARQPAPLMGFGPSQLFSGRTVPRASPRRVPTCRSLRPNRADSFSSGTGRLEPIRTCLNLTLCSSTLRGRLRCAGVRLLGVDPSVPAIQPPVDFGGGLCCPGLCLFRVCRAPDLCSAADSFPPSLVGRRLTLLRRLSALELGWSRWPVFAEPRWSAANQAGLAPPALQRLLAADAWLLRSRLSRSTRSDEQPV
jgi:hypothetical protein